MSSFLNRMGSASMLLFIGSGCLYPATYHDHIWWLPLIWPGKNLEKSSTDTQKESAEAAQNIDKQVQGKRRRVTNPSQYNRSPYRPK
jgi:hypothetical protein